MGSWSPSTNAFFLFLLLFKHAHSQHTALCDSYRGKLMFVCMEVAGRQVFHCKLLHCTQSLKLPRSTLQPFPAACPHLLLDTFQQATITQNTQRPSNLEQIHFIPLYPRNSCTFPPFSGSLQSITEQTTVLHSPTVPLTWLPKNQQNLTHSRMLGRNNIFQLLQANINLWNHTEISFQCPLLGHN